jgi:hypothetical protein
MAEAKTRSSFITDFDAAAISNRADCWAAGG